MAPLQGKTILIAEDHWIIIAALQTLLQEAGAHVLTAAGCDEARTIIESRRVDAALLDYKLGDGDCRDLCENLRQRGIPFVILSGYDRREAQVEGAAALLSKPCSEKVVLRTMIGVLAARLAPRPHAD